MEISESLTLVRNNIARAALRAGRRPEDILLIGATKMNDAARVREAIAAGLTACGENRVQEMAEKLGQGAYDGAELHFIGHLQKNKAKQVVGVCTLIHSVDNTALLLEIDRLARARGLRQDVLLEINVGEEPSKSGFRPDELSDALRFSADCAGIHVRGLMAIPPICSSPEENLPYFRAMNQLYVDNGEKKYDNVDMDFMSMGMSGDYEAAVACGANMVRVGTALFGPRDYSAVKI